MRVVLLGPNGQLGHDVRRAHCAAGEPFEVLPLSREQLDLTSQETIRSVLDRLSFDVLLNCTGYHRTDEAEDNAALAFTVNAHAVQTMARICALKKARFMHVSTDYVFGGDRTRSRPIGEDDAPSPVNVYGASKAVGETLAQHAADDVVILRVASLFGTAGSRAKGGNFVETITRIAREKRTLRVVGDQMMSPTFTADVVQVLMRMLTESCEPGVYHLVNSGSASWFEFAEEIVRQAGLIARVSSCTSEEYPTRASRPRYSVLDNSKVSSSIAPMPTWQDALCRYQHEKRT